MMEDKWKIWHCSYLFMETFCRVEYISLPLSFLLLRSYQKHIRRRLRNIPPLREEKKDLMRIQERCQPYLIPTRPSTSGNGCTLLRASWYPLSIGREERKFLYLAHHEKEYKQMVGNQLCRPLVNVRCLPEAPIPEREEMKVMKQLTHIWTAGSTPSLFKRPVFIRWMKGRVKTYLKRVRQLYYLFEHFPIMEVIYGSTLNANGVLVTSVAQKMGAFTVNMQHGVFGEVGHLPVNADLQLVWGGSHKEFLTSYGVPEEKIECIPPLFMQSIASEQSSAKRKGTSKKFHLLVALQPLGFSSNRYMIETIEEAVRDFSNRVRVSYKLHPDQTNGVKLYSGLLKNKHSRLVIHGTLPLPELMSQADLIITAFSTVAYEGILKGKPVLFFGKKRPIYYLQRTPSFVYQVAAIRRFLRRALQNKQFLSIYRQGLVLKESPGQKNKTGMSVWDVIDRHRAQC